MHSKHTKNQTNRAVSPVVGSILMVALVVIFTTMISGIILSQYSSPDNPPDADIGIDQNTHDDVNTTSNIRITTLETYNSNQINITTENTSINLYSTNNGPYIAYKTTNMTACAEDGKDETVIKPPQQTSNTTITKSSCILTPHDTAYNQTHITMTNEGDQRYICHIPDNTSFTITAQNDYGRTVTSTYDVRYTQDLTQYTIQPRYDHPCKNN